LDKFFDGFNLNKILDFLTSLTSVICALCLQDVYFCTAWIVLVLQFALYKPLRLGIQVHICGLHLYHFF